MDKREEWDVCLEAMNRLTVDSPQPSVTPELFSRIINDLDLDLDLDLTWTCDRLGLGPVWEVYRGSHLLIAAMVAVAS